MGMESTWEWNHCGHGVNIGTGSTWVREHGHGINTGMGTRAKNSSMQQLISSQRSGGGAPGKLMTPCLGHIKGNIQGTWIWNGYEHGREHGHRMKQCSNY